MIYKYGNDSHFSHDISSEEQIRFIFGNKLGKMILETNKIGQSLEFDWQTDDYWNPIITALYQMAQRRGVPPGTLLFIVPGVSRGESLGPNKNADYFPDKEIARNYMTFVQVAKNRLEHDMSKVIGTPLAAFYDREIMGRVYVLIALDPKRLPGEVLNMIQNGLAFGVSMGCQISFDVCSICGNIASNPNEYCEHLSIIYRCKICDKEFAIPDDFCEHIKTDRKMAIPVGTNRLKFYPEVGLLSYMKNYNPVWTDLSVVANPAAIDCNAIFAIHPRTNKLMTMIYQFINRQGRTFNE